MLVIGTAGAALALWTAPDRSSRALYRAWQGSQAGALVADTQVATTPGEWRLLWSSLRRDAPPAFDPARQTGVAIMLGQEPTPGYHVNVIGTEQRGDRLVVVVEVAHPSSRRLMPQVLSSPYTILLINRSGVAVSIEQRIRD